MDFHAWLSESVAKASVLIARLIAAVDSYLEHIKGESLDENHRPKVRVRHGSAAERAWEREKLAVIEEVDIIQAYVEQYDKRAPLWVAKAPQRLKAVEVLIANRAEKQDLAREEAQAVPFNAEGRIEIAAPFVTNPDGRWFLPGAGNTEWFKDIEPGPEMVVLPSGTFMMGSPEDEPERGLYEGPQHEVTIPRPFAIGRCAVTRGQFAAFIVAMDYDTGLGFGACPIRASRKTTAILSPM